MSQLMLPVTLTLVVILVIKISITLDVDVVILVGDVITFRNPLECSVLLSVLVWKESSNVEITP